MRSKSGSAPTTTHPAFEAAETFCRECSLGYADVAKPLRVEVITTGNHTETIVVIELHVAGYLTCKAAARRLWMKILKQVIAANGARMRVEEFKPTAP